MAIIASPVDLAAFGFRVEESELNAITAPKLFIGSEGDKTVPFAETRRMFDLSPDPKELQSYPGSAHGVQIFQTEHGDDLRQRLIAFITANAPPT
jgi:pimeloyl-ACP methyl ester carboxylesterase